MDLVAEFDVFISYATDPDYFLARALYRFLTTFHTLPTIAPRRIPALSVCLDSGSFLRRHGDRVLPVTEMVELYLQRSRQLLVLCSSGAVRSKHVAFEIEWFLRHRGEAGMHFAVTEGPNPSADPALVFPAAVLAAGLQQSVWYDLRGLRRWRARRWKLVRDASREQVRLVAEILLGAQKTSGLTADDLYPEWLEYEQRQARRRRARLAVAGSTLTAAAIIAGVALLRSQVQGRLASIRGDAAEATRIAAQQPGLAMAGAAGVWDKTQVAARRAKYLPALDSQLGQAQVEAQRTLLAVLSALPGFAGTLTSALENPLLGSSRDGQRFAIAGTTAGKHIIELWADDGARLRKTATFAWPEAVQCLALGLDGDRIVVAGRRYIGAWSITGGTNPPPGRTIDLAAGRFSDLSCSTAVISPDSKSALLGSNDGRLFELDMGTSYLRQLNVGELKGIVNDLLFAKDGSVYVAVWRRSPALLLLNLNAEPVAATPLEGEEAPRSLAADFEGTSLYSGDERGFVTARSMKSNQVTWRSRPTEASITSLCAVPEGVVVGDEAGAIVLLSAATGRPLVPPVRMTRTTITDLACLSKRGSVVVAGAGDATRLWRTDEALPIEQVVDRNTQGGLGVSLSSDGRRLTAFGPEELAFWDSDGAQWAKGAARRVDMPMGWRISAVTRDRHYLALTAAYADQTPDERILLMTLGGPIIALPGFEAKLWRGAFSPSGRVLAVGSFDRPLRVALWDIARPAADPRILEAPDGAAVAAIGFSRDESLLAVTDLRSCVYVWRVAAPSSRVTHCDQSESLGDLDFDPAGSRIAVGSLSGRIKVLLVSKAGLREERTLEGHRDSITALAFDASGLWLASASKDGELRFWDTTTWQSVGAMHDRDGSFVRDIVAGPGDGRVVALTQGGRRVSVWDLDPDRAARRAEPLSRPGELDTPLGSESP
jgi:WD40 repeat protein